MEPKILRANSRLITATRGAFLSSCHVIALPNSRAVPAARKYSGDIRNVADTARAFDGLRSVVSSRKIGESFVSPADANGGRSINPTDVTPGIFSMPSI